MNPSVFPGAEPDENLPPETSVGTPVVVSYSSVSFMKRVQQSIVVAFRQHLLLMLGCAFAALLILGGASYGLVSLFSRPVHPVVHSTQQAPALSTRVTHATSPSKQPKKDQSPAVATTTPAKGMTEVSPSKGLTSQISASSTAASSTPAASSSTPSSPTSTSQPSGGSGTSPSPPSILTISGVPAGISPGYSFENGFASLSAAQQQSTIATMKSDGVKWLRIDVASNFSPDAFISMATAAGIKVDVIFQDWNTSLTPGATASFVSQEVPRLKSLGVTTYEILNEPNGCSYTLSASSYTAILQAAYASVKAADPTATVISAGLCPSGGSNEPYTYLAAMYTAGVKGSFDAMNMHPYSYPDTPLQTSDSWNPWSYLAELHTIMVDNGDGNKQIWLTEFGCPTGTDGGYPADCTDASLANQITDAYDQARQQSWIGPLFIYDWQDSTSGDGDFGLYTASGAAKPQTLSAFEAAAAN